MKKVLNTLTGKTVITNSVMSDTWLLKAFGAKRNIKITKASKAEIEENKKQTRLLNEEYEAIRALNAEISSKQYYICPNTGLHTPLAGK